MLIKLASVEVIKKIYIKYKFVLLEILIANLSR